MYEDEDIFMAYAAFIIIASKNKKPRRKDFEFDPALKVFVDFLFCSPPRVFLFQIASLQVHHASYSYPYTFLVFADASQC